MPYHLPDDYLFFLEFYGGLMIEVPSYNISIFGLGPMVHEWYDDLMGDDALYENGFLLISLLLLSEYRPNNYVHFFLDLAGIVRQYCVIGMSSNELVEKCLIPVLHNPHAYPDRWTKHADSFTEWLEQLSVTNGSFGYLSIT
jgi:hypothetical protein